MIRVAVLDDHTAVLAGLRRLLEVADDLAPVAVADSAEKLLRALSATRADVAVVDYDLVRGDGLDVCQRLKEHVRPPAVVVYSAYAGPALALAAQIAGADAVVDKRAPAHELLRAVRYAARGESAVPAVTLEDRQALLNRLAPDEVPVAGMLLAGTSRHAIAQTLDMDPHEIASRVRRIVARIAPSSTPDDGWMLGRTK
jgi:DNA-binding NarL/FixJ family response regulator